MARSKRRLKKKKATGRLTSLWQRLIDWVTPSPTTTRVVRAFGWTALLTSVVLLAVIGVPKLHARAIARDLNQVTAEGVRVTFVNPPSVLDDLEISTLAATVRKSIGENTSPLMRGGLDAAAAALQVTGWFESIHQISWLNDGSIEVNAEYVTPVAVVRDSSGDVLIDSQGRRLKKTYSAGYAPLPLIIHASQAAPAGYGERWLGGDVQAGLALLQRIQGEAWFKQVVSIDVQQFKHQRLLALRTRACTIMWGHSPDDSTVQEVPVQQKLDYLAYLYHQYGAIDAACGGGELDIRRDVVTAGAPE